MVVVRALSIVKFKGKGQSTGLTFGFSLKKQNPENKI